MKVTKLLENVQQKIMPNLYCHKGIFLFLLLLLLIKNSYSILLNTYGLIESTCIVWIIVLGFFIVLTMEVILIVGIIFPILIWALVKKDIRKRVWNNNNLKNL